MEQHRPKGISQKERSDSVVLNDFFPFSDTFFSIKNRSIFFRPAYRRLQIRVLAIHKRIQETAFNYVKVSRNSQSECARTA